MRRRRDCERAQESAHRYTLTYAARLAWGLYELPRRFKTGSRCAISRLRTSISQALTGLPGRLLASGSAAHMSEQSAERAERPANASGFRAREQMK